MSRIGFHARLSAIPLAAGLSAAFLATVLAAGPSASRAASPPERREQGTLVIEGVPEIPKQLGDRLRQYQNTRSASVYDWTPDGHGLLIGTRFGETVQVHRVDRAGGDRRQITFYSEPIGGARSCPDPKADGLLFSKDVGGAENFQIYFHRFGAAGGAGAGTDLLLTDGTSRNTAPRWSSKGDRIAYSSNRRNGRDLDLYVAELSHPEKAHAVLEKEGDWAVLDWSPDDRRLLVEREVSVSESYLYVLDLASSALTQVNALSAPVAYGSALFDKRGDALYLTSDENSEFQRLRRLDLKSGRFTDLTAGIPWDVEEIAVAPSGDRVAFTVNERGFGRLYLLDTRTGKSAPVAGVPDGTVSGPRFDVSGGRLAFTFGSAVSPADAYVLDLAGGPAARPKRWTESEIGGLDPSAFVAAEAFDYPTFDQAGGAPRRIPAFLFKPRQGTGPFPVLINIHGGPESQYRATFSAITQFYAGELGLAVVAPNVRGSTGYGKSYVALDNGRLREDSVRDIGALLDWIGTRPDLDASRVAVIGGSYGGYMVLACMTHFSDRLKAGIDTVGISNFVSFLKNTSSYRQDLRRVEYGDERDPAMMEFLGQISPLNHVDRIRKPLFIIQGQNDPRVPLTESEQMLAAIKKNGVPAWYLMAKDEGHGFRKKPNVDFYNSAIVLFLQTHVLAPDGADGAAGASAAAAGSR